MADTAFAVIPDDNGLPDMPGPFFGWALDIREVLPPDWRDWAIGTKVSFRWSELDGCSETVGAVTEKNDDYLVVSAGGKLYMVDDYNAYLFY